SWRQSTSDRLLMARAVLLSVLMSSHKDRPQVSRLEIVETGRGRRWSDAEKLGIVEASRRSLWRRSTSRRRALGHRIHLDKTVAKKIKCETDDSKIKK